MFVKKIDKKHKSTGKVYHSWRLCQTYRIGGKVRHRNIINLGKMDDIPRTSYKLFSDRVEQILQGINPIFNDLPAKVESYAQLIAGKIIRDHLLDYPADTAQTGDILQEQIDIQSVDINTLEHEDNRSVGGEWLSLQMLERLCLPVWLCELLGDQGQARLVLMEIISRMVHPSSELETAHWLKEQSALCELLGEPKAPSYKELYPAARMLYAHKQAVESILYERISGIYPQGRKICLFDLTNFYFEGTKPLSEKAQFGRSKEKRSDARLISMALLTDGNGIVRKSEFYKGNISEPSTLAEVIGLLSEPQLSIFNDHKAVVVMDAGIATKENLTFLKANGYDYVCVSRQSLTDYTVIDEQPVMLTDNRDHPIEIKQVMSNQAEDTDTYLYVKSRMKSEKEHSMQDKLSKRFLEDLENIRQGLTSARGAKTRDKVNRRIGRLMERYPRVSRYYEITLECDRDTVTGINCRQSGQPDQAGVYFLRCSQRVSSEVFWEIYNTLREIESTFRCMKTDLDIRPIYHKYDINTEAHLFLGVVAYQIVHAIRMGLKKEGIHDDWKRIRQHMSTQTVVTTSMRPENRDMLYVRQATKPGPTATTIYQALKMTQKPARVKRKSVVPQIKNAKDVLGCFIDRYSLAESKLG